jgi:tetratricopeptide (TPR) repeat protein
MDYQAEYSLIQTLPRNEGIVRAEALLRQLDRTEQQNAVKETAFFLLDQYRLDDQIEAEILFAKQILYDSWFTDLKTMLGLTDRWIQAALKQEDFAEMESAVSFRERYLEPFPKEQTMQAFYRSVSFEGQKKYNLAIAALLELPDSLSGPKLTSKYLKLAMLYLKQHQNDEARKSLEHALIFDPNRKNEMFDLVESDLAHTEGDFEGALRYFEAFFLKTPQKTRYLDRYIDLNIELGRLDEADRFAREYAGKMAATTSKNYRVQFLEALIRLAKRLGHFDRIDDYVAQIKAIEPKASHRRDALHDLTVHLANHQQYTEERDIVLAVFRILSTHASYERLHWLQIRDDGVLFERYQSDRLYDKVLDMSMLKDTILANWLTIENTTILLRREAFLNNLDYATHQPLAQSDASCFLVKAIREADGLIRLLIAGLPSEDQFDTIQQTITLAAALMTEKVVALRRRIASELASRRANHWFDQTGVAIVSMAHGFVTLRNQAAKELFPDQGEIISYERFQSAFRMQKKLYPDDFIYQKVHRLMMIDAAQNIQQYRVETYMEDNVAYLYLGVMTQNVERKTEPTSLGSHNGTERIVASLKSHSLPLTIGWFRGEAMSGVGNDSFHRRAMMTQIVRQSFIQTAGDYLLDFDSVDHGDWLFTIDSIDKRVIQRIAKQTVDIIRDRFQNELSVAWDGRFAFVAMTLSKERPLETILDALEIAFHQHPMDGTVAFVERSTIETIERSNALHVRLEEMLKSDRLELRYVPYLNRGENTVEYWLAKPHDTIYEDDDLLQLTIDRFHLEVEFDQAIWKKAVREFELVYRQTKRHVRFAVSLSATFLSRPASGRLLILEAKRRKLPLDYLLVFVDCRNQGFNQTIAYELAYLHEKGILIGMRIDASISLSTVSQFSNDTYLWLDSTNPSPLLQALGNRMVVIDQDSIEDVSTATLLTPSRLQEVVNFEQLAASFLRQKNDSSKLSIE